MATKILDMLPPLIQKRLIEDVLGLAPNDSDTTEKDIVEWVRKHAPKKVEPAISKELDEIMKRI